MKLNREEQETHVWGNAGSTEWEIYAADPKYIRRLTKLGYPVVGTDHFGTRYRVPLHSVRFGRLKNRVVSEKQKERMRKTPSFVRNPICSETPEDQNLPEVSTQGGK